MTLTHTSGLDFVGPDFFTLIDSGSGGVLRYQGADVVITSDIADNLTLEMDVQKYDPESNTMRVYDRRTRSSTFFTRTAVNIVSFPMIPTARFILRARLPGISGTHPVRWVHYEQEEP